MKTVGARHVVPLRAQANVAQSVISAQAETHPPHALQTSAKVGVYDSFDATALPRVSLQRLKRHLIERLQSNARGIGAKVRVPFQIREGVADR